MLEVKMPGPRGLQECCDAPEHRPGGPGHLQAHSVWTQRCSTGVRHHTLIVVGAGAALAASSRARNHHQRQNADFGIKVNTNTGECSHPQPACCSVSLAAAWRLPSVLEVGRSHQPGRGTGKVSMSMSRHCAGVAGKGGRKTHQVVQRAGKSEMTQPEPERPEKGAKASARGRGRAKATAKAKAKSSSSSSSAEGGKVEGGDEVQLGPRPSLGIVLGCLTIWTWPWLVGSLFRWTRSLRPVFKNHPLFEFGFYSCTGLILVSASLGKRPWQAGSASKHAIWSLLQWLGYQKWLAEMLSAAAFSFISGSSRAMLFFVGINLCVNALPDNWSVHMPSYIPIATSLGKTRGTDKILQAGDLELIVFRASQRALFAFFSSLLGYCLLKFKRVPQTPVPEAEGLRFSRDQESWVFPSLACLIYAKQNPQDKRVRKLVQRLALPDRMLDFFALFGLVILPWTYLLGFRPQTVLAVGGVGGLAVGLAAQNLVGNLIAGMLINLNRPFGEGDEIQSGGEELQGIVDDVGFTVTRINRLDGVSIYVPNSKLLDGVVVNRTIKDFRFVQEAFPVFAEDLKSLPLVVQQLQSLLDTHPDVLHESQIFRLKQRRAGKLKLFPPVCAFTGYGTLGAKLFIQAYMRGSLSNPDFLKAKSDLLLQVNKCLLDNGLSIGFGCFTQFPQVPGINEASSSDPPEQGSVSV